MRKTQLEQNGTTKNFIKETGTPFDVDPETGDLTVYTRETNKGHERGLYLLGEIGMVRKTKIVGNGNDEER